MNPQKVGNNDWIAFVCAGKREALLKKIGKRVNDRSIQADETKTVQQELVFIFPLRKERNM